LKNIKRIFLLALCAAAVGLISYLGFQYTSVAADPLGYVHENDVWQASDRLVRNIVAQNSRAESSASQLLLIMQKLRDGWPGFIADNEYPYQYAPDMLLYRISWRIGGAAQQASSSARKALIKILRECPPIPGNKDKLDSYNSLFRTFKLDE